VVVEDRCSWLDEDCAGIRMAVFIDRVRCSLLGNLAVWKEDTNRPVKEGAIAIVMTISMVAADVETPPPIRMRMYRIMTVVNMSPKRMLY